jgi:hypothetical protein
MGIAGGGVCVGEYDIIRSAFTLLDWHTKFYTRGGSTEKHTTTGRPSRFPAVLVWNDGEEEHIVLASESKAFGATTKTQQKHQVTQTEA